jgi:hypothetical protein
MRMTHRLVLCASIAALLALPGVASAEPSLIAPGTTGITAPSGIVRTPDGAVWVADEVDGVCRVATEGTAALVDSPWCGGEPHAEEEAPETEDELAAPVPVIGETVAPGSVSGLVFDARNDSFYVGDRRSAGGGVWRLHYDRASGAIDGGTQIFATADRVDTVALSPAGRLYFLTKRAGQIMRIADPTADVPAAPEVVATIGPGAVVEPEDETAPEAPETEVEDEVETMAATDDALYLGGTGLKRLSLSGTGATPQLVAGFEGREVTGLAIDGARGRLYVGDVAPQLGDIVEVVDVATGEREPYEQGFATVTTLGVDADGAVLVGDDPTLATQATAWHARLWHVPLQPTGRPQAAITSAPPAASPATDATFAYQSRDGATFECRLDDGAFMTCAGTGSGEQTYRDLAEGEHRLSVRAIDGHTGLHATTRFTLDRTAPVVTAIQPTTEYAEGVSTPRIRFSANESGITYTCSLDWGPFKQCFSGNPIDNLSAGVHVLRVVATDAAGNRSAANAPAATVRIVVHARFRPADDNPGGTTPPPPSAGVAGTTATSEAKPVLFPFTLRFKDAAGKTRTLRFGLDAPGTSAQLRVTVKDWRRRTVLTRVVTVRPDAHNRVSLTLTRAEQRRLRPGRYLVRAVLRTARGVEGNAQTHWLRVRR